MGNSLLYILPKCANVSPSLSPCSLLLFSIAVPPTAVWISQKDQHLLAGQDVEFACQTAGASPAVRFTWWIDRKQVRSGNARAAAAGGQEEMARVSRKIVLGSCQDLSRETL